MKTVKHTQKVRIRIRLLPDWLVVTVIVSVVIVTLPSSRRRMAEVL